MNDKTGNRTNGPGRSGRDGSDREARLRAALRANLHRRKAQARARQSGPAADDRSVAQSPPTAEEVGTRGASDVASAAGHDTAGPDRGSGRGPGNGNTAGKSAGAGAMRPLAKRNERQD